MYTVLIVLIVILAILMCFIVLIQESKGGGLASSFSASNQIMGVRKTTDVIEKLTWGLAAAMVVFSVVSVFFIPKVATEESAMMKAAGLAEALAAFTGGAIAGTPLLTPAVFLISSQNAAPAQGSDAASAPAPAQPAANN